MPSIREFAESGVGLIQQGLNREGVRASVRSVDLQVDGATGQVKCNVEVAVSIAGGGLDVFVIEVGFDRLELEKGGSDVVSFVHFVVARPAAKLIRERLAEKGSADTLPSGARRLGETRLPWEDRPVPRRNPWGSEVVYPREAPRVGYEFEFEIVPMPGRGTSRPDDSPSWIDHQWVLDEQGRGACAACGRLRSELDRAEHRDRCARVTTSGDVVEWYAPVDPSQEDEPDADAPDEEDGDDEPGDEDCDCEQCRGGIPHAPASSNPCGEVALTEAEVARFYGDPRYEVVELTLEGGGSAIKKLMLASERSQADKFRKMMQLMEAYGAGDIATSAEVARLAGALEPPGKPSAVSRLKRAFGFGS